MMSHNTVSYEPADIIIHIQGRGIVLKEKSLIAFQKSDDKILAFGSQAQEMAEKDLENVVVMSPLRQGMIADFSEARSLFSCLFVKALGKKPLLKPPVAVCVPKGITSVEQKAMEEVLIEAGASEILVSDIPAEEFIRELPESFPKLYRKFKITVGITKEEPERYVEERIREILMYAGQEKIPQERIQVLLREITADCCGSAVSACGDDRMRAGGAKR